jgi:hypothetical protein
MSKGNFTISNGNIAIPVIDLIERLNDDDALRIAFDVAIFPKVVRVLTRLILDGSIDDQGGYWCPDEDGEAALEDARTTVVEQCDQVAATAIREAEMSQWALVAELEVQLANALAKLVSCHRCPSRADLLDSKALEEQIEQLGFRLVTGLDGDHFVVLNSFRGREAGQ